jgi:CDP-diacylglycerol--serine O-phosphatidyltransferase
LASKHRSRSWIVNGCTSLNLVLGMATVFLATHGYMQSAAICLLGSVVWDAADGFLARRWQVASEFGAQLDSLADMTSFAVGGGAFVYGWFAPVLPNWVVIPLACWFALCGGWRLARFNVGPKLAGEFYGLPTTAVATLLGVLFLTCPQLASWPAAFLAAVLAWLMISPLPYPKYTRFTELPIWMLLSLPLISWYRFYVTIWTLAVLYLLSGPLIWWHRRQMEVRDEAILPAN